MVSVNLFRQRPRQQDQNELLGLTKIGYLSAQELFCDFSAEELERLERATTLVKAKKGEVVFDPARAEEKLFIIKEGEVHIWALHSDGRKLIKAVLGRGAIFGQMAVLGQSMCGSTAQCSRHSVLCSLGPDQFQALMLAKPRVALRLISALGKRLLQTEALLEDLAFRDVPSRLASVLLRLCQEKGPFIQGLTHQEIAERVNAARPTVTQTLNEFRRSGLVGLNRRWMLILDQERLAALAGRATATKSRYAP